MTTTTPDAPVSVCWSVQLDLETGSKEELGTFASCEGLGMEVVLEQREEGGNNRFVWQLPSRIKYSNVKLTRPVCAHTAAVVKWLASMTGTVKPCTATVSARTADGTTVTSWQLLGVVPVRWSGPSLNADSPKVAMETIEFAHHGFTV
ncbi:MAG: phage tail protein [Actinomycetales bacterium]